MIDFHSHILPNMDDGPDNVSQCLAMLRQSFLQGVDLVVATSHFYGDEECPRDFMRRRARAVRVLNEAMFMSPEVYPRVLPGAEVLYFPGISEAEDISGLMIKGSACILIEPPMAPWSDAMLDEITQMGENFECTPVIAHVDRYMTFLKDESLMKRVRERDMLVQVNGSYFLNPKTVKSAIHHLKNGEIQLLGSDCHDMEFRAPNLGIVRKQIKSYSVEAEFKKLHRNAEELLHLKG